MSAPHKAENEQSFHTPIEALEHLVVTLERGERVQFWAITEARRALDTSTGGESRG